MNMILLLMLLLISSKSIITKIEAIIIKLLCYYKRKFLKNMSNLNFFLIFKNLLVLVFMWVFNYFLG